METYERKLECVLTSGDPARRFAPTHQWDEILGCTDRRRCLCNCNSRQWSDRSRWALGCRSDRLRIKEERSYASAATSSLESWSGIWGEPEKLLPRHWTSVPLQSPLDKHSRTLEPTSVYPVLQEKMAVAPYTVSVPILLPFGGVPRSPQEMT